MINEEAQRIIDGYIVGANYTNEDYVDCVNVEALRAASVALEKQVPSRPKRIGYINSDNGRFITTHTDCPSCDYGVIERNKYCPRCGQALDWKKVGE